MDGEFILLLHIAVHDILTQLGIKFLGTRNECEERTAARNKSAAGAHGIWER